MRFEMFTKHEVEISGGGGEVNELMDRQGCAILALEMVPKNLIFV